MDRFFRVGQPPIRSAKAGNVLCPKRRLIRWATDVVRKRAYVDVVLGLRRNRKGELDNLVERNGEIPPTQWLEELRPSVQRRDGRQQQRECLAE